MRGDEAGAMRFGSTRRVYVPIAWIPRLNEVNLDPEGPLGGTTTLTTCAQPSPVPCATILPVRRLVLSLRRLVFPCLLRVPRHLVSPSLQLYPSIHEHGSPPDLREVRCAICRSGPGLAASSWLYGEWLVRRTRVLTCIRSGVRLIVHTGRGPCSVSL